jgi:hypothetical protein
LVKANAKLLEYGTLGVHVLIGDDGGNLIGLHSARKCLLD